MFGQLYSIAISTALDALSAAKVANFTVKHRYPTTTGKAFGDLLCQCGQDFFPEGEYFYPSQLPATVLLCAVILLESSRSVPLSVNDSF